MTEIPGYRIRRELGHGGMATVYLAVQESLERSVALKVMAPALATDRTFTQRFIKEGKTIAKFNHPHIIGIYDVGVSNGYHYIAMEHVSGGDLKTRLRRDGAIDPIEALRICKDVATALHYAHRQGFIHRDVKSENILFRDDGAAVLTDFGIAKAVDSGTKMTGTGMSIGTPHYMSPEQARGKPLDGRSDLYSLGIVLYEMFTGKVPFQAEDSVAIGIMHVSHPVPELPDSLGSYRNLLKKLLAKDPRDRYQSAQDLIKVCDDMLVASGSISDPSLTMPAIEDDKPRMDPKRKMVVGALLSGGLLLVALVGYIINSGLLDTLFESQQIQEAKQNRLEQPAQLAQGRAILQIVSAPAGADVFLDGFKLGVTPFISDTLPAGRHQLKLTHKYYSTLDEQIELVADEVVKRDVSLLRGRGAVTVLSDPPNAVVYFNGERQPERTPTTLDDVPAGEHTIALQLERFLRKEIQVEVLPKQTGRTIATLEGGDLVEVGDQWMRPADASPRFIELARAAAAEGEVQATQRYLEGARRYATAATATVDDAALLALARRERNRRDAAEAAARSAMRTAEAAVAAYDKNAAIEAYREALSISPEYEPALNGLARAEAMKVPGEVFRDELSDGSSGPEMVVVSAGSFVMGSAPGEPSRDTDEGPTREVRIARPFAIGKYEVTFEEYDRFALAMGRERPRDRGWGRRRQPVINVSWNDATDYVEWLSRVTGEAYRLPAEAEWEYTTRAGTRTIYWWGNVMEKNKANCDGCGTGWEEKRTTPVGSFNPNLFGLYDTAGNVFEWTADCYNSSYANAPVDGSAWISGNCNRRVYRGGSWYFGPTYLRSADRAENIRSYRSSNVGFRVVRDLD